MKRGSKKINTWLKYFSKEDQEAIMKNVIDQKCEHNLKAMVTSQSDALICLFAWNDEYDKWNTLHEQLKTKGK